MLLRFKTTKMGEPNKYSRKLGIHDVFYSGSTNFLNWLRSHSSAETKAGDPISIKLLGKYVEGIAADWYAADVGNPDQTVTTNLKLLVTESVVGTSAQTICQKGHGNKPSVDPSRPSGISPSRRVEGFISARQKG